MYKGSERADSWIELWRKCDFCHSIDAISSDKVTWRKKHGWDVTCLYWAIRSFVLLNFFSFLSFFRRVSSQLVQAQRNPLTAYYVFMHGWNLEHTSSLLPQRICICPCLASCVLLKSKRKSRAQLSSVPSELEGDSLCWLHAYEKSSSLSVERRVHLSFSPSQDIASVFRLWSFRAFYATSSCPSQ